MLRIKIHPAFMLTLTERQELIVRIKALVQKTQRNTETEDAFVIGDYRLDPVAQKLYHLGEIDEELSYRANLNINTTLPEQRPNCQLARHPARPLGR